MELLFLCWKSTCKYIYIYIFFSQLYRYPILVLQNISRIQDFLMQEANCNK